MLWSNR